MDQVTLYVNHRGVCTAAPDCLPRQTLLSKAFNRDGEEDHFAQHSQNLVRWFPEREIAVTVPRLQAIGRPAEGRGLVEKNKNEVQLQE